MPNVKNYEKCYQSFTWKIPRYYNFGFDVIDRHAKNRSKLALISVSPDAKSSIKHTFYELSAESNKFVNALLKIGIRKGDRCFVMLPRIPEWYVVMLGLIKLGAIVMPATVMCPPEDIKYRINRAEANLAITDLEDASKVEEIKRQCPTLKHLVSVGGEIDGWLTFENALCAASRQVNRKALERTKSTDPLLIFFTSGTEREPKMVIHQQVYSMAHVVTGKYVQDIKPTDVHWTIADTGWAKAAWGKLFGPWMAGATVLQWNQMGKFEPEIVAYIIETYGVTTLCAPPTAYRMLVLQDFSKYDLSTLRHCSSAGEPLNPEVIRSWRKLTGLEIYDIYGQSESVCLLGNFRCNPIRHGSMGKPTPGHYVSIVDDDGNELKPGEEGQVAVRITPEKPPGLFIEYWQEPEANAKVFRNGWYYTGDLAYKDEDGYFWFVGRADDTIKASGYRIGPFEVESALIEHPAVAECAVIGVSHPVRGQIIKAFVILAPGYTGGEQLTRELQEHVRKVTAPYKYPREIEYVHMLPKTISGKIKRGELRKMELQRRHQ